jgi:hypothetical protein
MFKLNQVKLTTARRPSFVFIAPIIFSNFSTKDASPLGKDGVEGQAWLGCFVAGYV